MNIFKYSLLVLMIINLCASSLLFSIYSKDVLISASTIINLLISFYLCLNFSPEKNKVKLVFVYLSGFSLFICGRFISNIMGVEYTFCFDFGYYYCLTDLEIIKSNFLINLSLILFVYGFLYNNHNGKLDRKGQDSIRINLYIYYFLLIIALLCGVYTIYLTAQSVIKAMSYGYLSLYSAQSEDYSSPLSLMISIFFNAFVALSYSLRDRVKYNFFIVLFCLFITNLLITVLAGSRANFVSALIVLAWLYLGDRKLTFKNFIFIAFLGISVFLTNFIASLTGARDAVGEDTSIMEKISEDIFYNQGITLMVFNMGIKMDDYPFLAYLKTIFPGSQIIYSFFYDIKPYELSFSQNLMYELSPSLFYEGYGLAWSLLGDFYAFSFGFLFIFLFYNFIWGKLIYRISNLYDFNDFYKGIYFCFLMSIFILSRFSISSFLVLIVMYFLMFNLLRIKL